MERRVVLEETEKVGQEGRCQGRGMSMSEPSREGEDLLARTAATRGRWVGFSVSG